jgi:hypothetical protein
MRSLALVAASLCLPACISADDQLHRDGDGMVRLGAIDHEVGAMFTETDGFLNFLLAPGTHAEDGRASGLPIIQFSMEYDQATTDLRAPGLSNLNISEGDQRLIVLERSGNSTQELYAVDGFVLYRSHTVGVEDGERVMHEAGGLLEVTLEDGRALTGEFSAVRSE